MFFIEIAKETQSDLAPWEKADCWPWHLLHRRLNVSYINLQMAPPLLGGKLYKDVPCCHRHLHVCRISWHPGAFVVRAWWSLMFGSHLPLPLLLPPPRPPPPSVAGSGSYFSVSRVWARVAAVTRHNWLLMASSYFSERRPCATDLYEKAPSQRHTKSSSLLRTGDGVSPVGVPLPPWPNIRICLWVKQSLWRSKE